MTYPIETLLPESGPGFVTFYRGENGKNQYGQQSTIDAALSVASAWNELHPDRPMAIGQISLKGGGPMGSHQLHQKGVDLDIRPERKDLENTPVDMSDPQYSRTLTTELINLWWEEAPVKFVYFNDPSVIAAHLSQHSGGHDDHFHVNVREKWEIIKKGNRGSDVKEVQRKLGIGIDGKFGTDTETAVKQFQAAHGLAVDGVVGEHTWPLLDSLSSTASNFVGKGLALDEAGFSDAMNRMTVGAPELWAVMKIETNGFGFLRDRRPVILYERHIFSKKTNHQFDVSHPDISNPVGGGYGAGGAHQYDRLERAISLNRPAALESASWGVGQLMGFNAEIAGYSDVEAMVTAMLESENEQLRGMTGEIVHNGLHVALREHRWADFAYGYNGSGYASNHYDTRLAAAYHKYAQGPMPNLTGRAAQVYLTYLGFNPGPVDGWVGPLTYGALNRFQQQNGLPVINQIDEATVSLLREKAIPEV